jgi:hypothetical protein
MCYDLYFIIGTFYYNMEKKSPVLFALSLIVIITMALESCKYDNLEELKASCDTSQVTYSETIVPILEANCYRCHGTNSNSGSGGVILQNYNVLNGFAASGELYGNVAHLPGYNAMPYDGGKLSDCDIAKIKKWIDNGHPNN